MNSSNNNNTKKAYVLVTNLPPSFRGNNFFHKLLKQQIGGGLLGALLEDESTVGLAVFDSARSALAACKETIQFKGTKNADGTIDVFTAKLRIVETEHQAKAAASVYCDTIVVEGETVKRELLDFTYGLQLANRGEQGAAWCNHTRNKESCPLGVKCKFLHLREHQATQKRLRGVAVSGAGGASGAAAEDRNVAVAEMAGIPFLPPRLASLALTPQMAEGLLNGDDAIVNEVAAKLFGDALSASSAAVGDADAETVARSFIRIESAIGGTTEMDFFTETAEGVEFLKSHGRCVLPSNGCPTPIERDAFMCEMLKKRNIASALLADAIVRGTYDPTTKAANTAGPSPSEATTAKEPLTREALQVAFARRLRHFAASSPNVRRQLSADTIAAAPVRLTLQPRYAIASPAVQELTFYVRNGLVTGVAQHFEDVLAPRSLFRDPESADLRDDLQFIVESSRAVRSKIEQWAARAHRAAMAAAGVTSSSSSSSFSAAIHVAFPCGVYTANLAETTGGVACTDSTAAASDKRIAYPLAANVPQTPQALLLAEEAVTEAQFTGAAPVILGAKVYESAVAQSSLFSDSSLLTAAAPSTKSAEDTRTTRPLWRRLRASPTPLFPRSTIDKFAEW